MVVRQLLYGGGDAREPLPETMRLLDEIATDFIQSLSFEAARIGQYSGRQKIKYEDFEFALRRNPLFLGKVREMFEMSKEVKDARKMPGIGEGNLAKADVNELAKLGGDGEEGVTDVKNGDASGAAGDGASRATSTSGPARGKKRGPYAKTAGKRKKAKMEEEAAAAAAAAAAAGASAGAEPEVKVKEEPQEEVTGASGVGATADSADGAADEEPDAEEPSNLDALFGGGDDDVFGGGNDADGDADDLF